MSERIREKVGQAKEIARQFIEHARGNAKRLLIGLVGGAGISAAKRYAPSVKQLHNFARDTIKRPQYAGHVVAIPALLLGGFVLREYDEDAALYTAFKAGDLGGEIIEREISGEPIIRLYPDRIELERFDPEAEVILYIDGRLYTGNDFETPEYGRIENGRMYTDADGKFKAKFKEKIPEGEHDVAVTTGKKALSMHVEI